MPVSGGVPRTAIKVSWLSYWPSLEKFGYLDLSGQDPVLMSFELAL
jgi:hypothetical protein